MQLTLYGKPDCLLCDELKADLMSMRDQATFSLTVRNIEEDPTLFERYQTLIPVLDIEGGQILYPPHTWQRTLSALQAAGRSTQTQSVPKPEHR